MTDDAEHPAALHLEIRYAAGDEDVIALHRWLCVVAAPVLMAPIDAQDSIAGVADVVNGNVAAILAEIRGEIVGAIGLVAPAWWYNHRVKFMTDRFFFVFPQLANQGIGAALLAEAHALATRCDLELVINGKMVRRNRAAGRGLVFRSPVVLHPDHHTALAS
jgi:GNAT superfamily N-acetyltransferase